MTAPGATEVANPRRWRILFVLLVTIFMSLVAVSILNVALPSIQESLGASEAELQWVLSGYALTFGVILVAAGRAGDLYGRGVLFIVGVALFTCSSIAAALAPNPLTLIIVRLLQGLGSGLIGPQTLGMIQQYFGAKERGRAFGMYGSTVGISVAAGPLIGGLLIEAAGVHDGWRWTFFVNVPVGILAIVLAAMWFPRPLLRRPSRRRSRFRRGETASRESRDLDPVGATLLGLAVLGILLPFSQTGSSPWLWVLLPAGLGCAVGWVCWERGYKRRGRSPMVDLAIFRTPSFSNGTLLISLYFLGVTSVWVLVALYLQDGLGRSALVSGLMGLPSAVMTMITAHWAGSNVHRFGRPLVIGGMCVVLLGLGSTIAVVQLTNAVGLSEWWLLLSLAFVGAGQGAVISPNQTLTLEEVPLQYAGSSGGVMQTGQRIGTSVGITVISSLAFVLLGRWDWTQAATGGFFAVGVIVVLALLVSARDLRIRHHRAAAASR